MQHLTVRDLNLSKNWGTERADNCPCIVSTSVLWVRGRKRRRLVNGSVQQCDGDGQVVDRLMSGEECLRIQGFALADQTRGQTETWTHKQKVDLAGNAMDSGLLHAVFSAAVASNAISQGIVAMAAHASEVGLHSGEQGEEDCAEDEKSAGAYEEDESEEEEKDPDPCASVSADFSGDAAQVFFDDDLAF